MSFRNERMARKFLSLDKLAETIDLGKSRLVSDRGEGARQIRGEDGAEDAGGGAQPDTRAERLADARRRLVESGLKRLLPVLEQIVKNGKNRKESICNLAIIWRRKKEGARREYYRGVKELLTFFSPCKIKGQTTPQTSVLHNAAQEI